MPPPRKLDPSTLADHLDRLYRAAWALCGSREDAEDLVQETYTRVLARPRLIYREDDLGYLLRVLRNTFVSGRGAGEHAGVTLALPSHNRAAREWECMEGEALAHGRGGVARDGQAPAADDRVADPPPVLAVEDRRHVAALQAIRAQADGLPAVAA